MKDYVYYVCGYDDLVLTEHIFSSYDEAVDYAEQHAIKDYHILEWDVD